MVTTEPAKAEKVLSSVDELGFCMADDKQVDASFFFFLFFFFWHSNT
jgi:hypothetical protein